MTQRERRMAILLLGFLVLGGAFLGYQMIVRPLTEYSNTIASLVDDIDHARLEVAKIDKDRKQLDRWRLMSLPIDPAHPADLALARNEYFKYLEGLLRKNRFEELNLNPVEGSRVVTTQAGKKPVFTPVDFNIRARVSLANLVQMMDEFQSTHLMHKIKSITIDRPENAPATRRKREDIVAVQMSVEAIVIGGSERRQLNLLGIDYRLPALDALTVLEGGPAAIALLPGVLSPTLDGKLDSRMRKIRQSTGTSSGDDYPLVRRDYRDIAKKNIFQGPATVIDKEEVASGEEIEVTRFTYLTDITLSDWRSEAFIYNRANHRKMRLRISPGFNTFRVTDDEDKIVLSGKVVKIEPRDIYFLVGASYYRMHVGQNISDAMRQKLPSSEAKSLGLVASAKYGD